MFCARGAESESESPEVVAASRESESESIKLPGLRLRNVLFEYAIQVAYAGEKLHALFGNNFCRYRL